LCKVYNTPRVRNHPPNSLNGVLGKLAGSSFLIATARRIADNAAVIAAELTKAVLADVPQFSASMNPDILPESARHAAQHVEEILRLLRGGRLGSFEFVRAHAQRRAEQRFPLEATLHAYRTSHKVLSRWLRGPLATGAACTADSQRDTAALADFAMDYTDSISTTFASAYSAHTLSLADLAGDQRAELLQILLDGHDEADLRVTRILREAGIPNKQRVFCVALARSVDPAEMLNASRARRLADSIEQVMAESAVRRIVDVYANKVTMVFADVHRLSGWTAPRSSLARRMSEALAFVGNAALIGVSNDVPSTAHIPQAYREATAALEMAHVTQRVVQFSELSMQRLLLYFAGEEFRRLLPGWADEFHVADEHSRGALSATLRAYASADMNVLRAAHTLGVHPNTLYARFQRIFDICGLQARSFNALVTLLTVCDCLVDSSISISESGRSSATARPAPHL
jgi:sugar diacid utilization regulator